MRNRESGVCRDIYASFWLPRRTLICDVAHALSILFSMFLYLRALLRYFKFLWRSCRMPPIFGYRSHQPELITTTIWRWHYRDVFFSMHSQNVRRVCVRAGQRQRLPFSIYRDFRYYRQRKMLIKILSAVKIYRRIFPKYVTIFTLPESEDQHVSSQLKSDATLVIIIAKTRRHCHY